MSGFDSTNKLHSFHLWEGFLKFTSSISRSKWPTRQCTIVLHRSSGGHASMYSGWIHEVPQPGWWPKNDNTAVPHVRRERRPKGAPGDRGVQTGSPDSATCVYMLGIGHEADKPHPQKRLFWIEKMASGNANTLAKREKNWQRKADKKEKKLRRLWSTIFGSVLPRTGHEGPEGE